MDTQLKNISTRHSTRAESLPGWGPGKQLAHSLTESGNYEP